MGREKEDKARGDKNQSGRGSNCIKVVYNVYLEYFKRGNQFYFFYISFFQF